MKCDCGWTVPPGKQCLNPQHLRSGKNRSWGPRRATGALVGYEKRLHNTRCPQCRGYEVEGREVWGGKPCWVSTCSRGPRGKRCSCHHPGGVAESNAKAPAPNWFRPPRVA